MEILPHFDKQGEPIGLAFAFAGSLLLLLFILMHNQKPKDMHRSRITRTVVGNVTDPSSTRNLGSMTHEEFTQIRLAVLAAQSEAETYCLMRDDILLETIESNRRACCHVGLEIPPCELPEVSLMREFFAGRAEYCLGFLARMGEKPWSRIKGITPDEFMHLVASFQAGCREATIGLAYPESLITEAF